MIVSDYSPEVEKLLKEMTPEDVKRFLFLLEMARWMNVTGRVGTALGVLFLTLLGGFVTITQIIDRIFQVPK